ncbi:MAG: MBL fold metallo-hydrolase [Candidatus Hodarchaeota archaeon]
MLIDPGKKALGRVKADFVYATHRHLDHTRGIEEFLKFNDESSNLICNEKVAQVYVKWKNRVKMIEDGEMMDK